MSQSLASQKELESQAAELQHQLAEAQELLSAIRRGEVDALVVPGPAGARIYSLAGAEEPYRVLIEEMSEGAATLSSDGTVLYCNRRLADLVGVPLESVIGSAFASLLVPEDRQAFAELLERAHVGRTQRQMACGNGRPVLQLSMNRLPRGGSEAVSLVAVDITERFEAQQSTEARLDLLFDSTAEGLFGLDLDGNCTFANRAGLEMLGHTGLESLLGKNLHSIIRHSSNGAAPCGQQDECRIELVLRQGVNVHASGEFLGRADGTSFPVEYWCHPVRKDGQFIGAVLAFIDISQRQQAQEWLRKSEERFRELAENIREVFFVAGTAPHRVEYISPAYEQVWGRPRQDLYANGYAFVEAVHPDDRSLAEQMLAQAAQGLPTEAEFRVFRPDGTFCWVCTRAFPVCDSSGKFLNRVAGIAEDITDRKRHEDNLRKSEQRFRLIAETIEEVFWMADTGMDQMVYVSPAYERIWGRSRDSLYKDPRSFLQAVHPEDRCQVLSTLECQKSELPFDHEYRILRPDGSHAWIWDRGFPVRGANNRVEFYVGLAQDITGRKWAAAELERAKEIAEAANRAKSEFLANMSHEIRTPMNGIVGMTELAMATELTLEQHEYLEMIKSSADSLRVVIDDILDFSKIEAGKLDLESREFNLEEVLGPALKLLGLQAGRKGLEVNFHLPPGTPGMVVGDGNRLRQVVVNLVGNAIKFTERGAVTVRALCEPVKEGTTWFHFSVQDTGIGIRTEQQKAIFDAFTQADGSVTRRYGGTGLGLTISRRLVEMMGGRLWLESAPGEGSMFHFTVPLSIAKQSGQEPVQPVDLTSGLSVLVVDDNDSNRRIIEEILISWSMRPTLARDARTALNHLVQESRAGRPLPLVIVDRNMPEIDGFTLVEQIRQDPRLARATILMLTSGGQPGDAARSQKLGVSAYLTKPVGQTELRNAVLHALGPWPVKTQVGAPKVELSRKPLNILVAEDNVVNQKVISRLLEKRGHRVEIAANGREALNKLSRAGFDLVLMDVQMPEMDGIEATVAIRRRELHTGDHLPIVALTAHALKADLDRCLAVGMDGYLSKPVRLDDLFRQIERLYPGHTVAPHETVETR